MVRGVIRYMKAEPKLPEKRAVRPGQAPVPSRLMLAAPIDLTATQEEQVDPALSREVEEFAGAFREGVAGALVQQREADVVAEFPQQPAGGGGDGTGRAHGDVAGGRGGRVEDQAGECGGKAFFGLDHAALAGRTWTCSAR